MQLPARVLTASGVGKDYEGRPALKGLTFSLGAGRILGFLGPNGAGKTTAIRILTTIIEPTTGTFTVAGISSENPQAIRQRIGVLPESLGFPKRNTALEYLTYFGQHYGMARLDSRDRALTLLREVGLTGRENSIIGSYSRGMRQRLGIARTLLGDPMVVFLDEPTLGLDPRGKQELLGIVERIARDRSAGVVLCSHLLAEVESVCDDVIILKDGQVVADGSVEDVTARKGSSSFVIEVDPGDSATAVNLLTTDGSPLRIRPKPRGRIEVDISADHTDDARSLRRNALQTLLSNDIDVVRISSESSRLEDVFLELTEEGSREIGV